MSYPFRTQIITHSLKDPSGDATQTTTTTNCDNEIPCDTTTTENENNNLKQSTSCTSDDSEGGARRLVTFFFVSGREGTLFYLYFSLTDLKTLGSWLFGTTVFKPFDQ